MIRLNSDKELVKEIKKKLKDNNGFCPCRLDKSLDSKCMCKEFRDQIANKEQGFCYCGLYEYINDEED